MSGGQRYLAQVLSLAVIAGCACVTPANAKAGEPPVFGIESFANAFAEPPFSEEGIEADSPPLSEPFLDRGGVSFSQAGGRPFAMTTTVVFNHVVAAREVLNPGGQPEEDVPTKSLVSSSPKDMTVDLPPGVVADPQATATRCDEASLEDEGACPASSAVGVLAAYTTLFPNRVFAPLFNMVAPAGVAAQFGANPIGFGYVIHIDGRLRTLSGSRGKSEGGYALSGEATGIQDSFPLYGVVATFWGDPSAAAHDPVRGACGERTPAEKSEGSGVSCPLSERPETAFLSMSGACSTESLVTGVDVESWKEPGVIFPAEALSPPVTDCSELKFKPTVEAKPETAAANSPTGLRFDLHVPQNESASGDTLATANVKDAAVSLPDGMTLNPSSAGGLAGCPLLTGQEGDRGEKGINLESDAPPRCPNASKIGEVEVVTPLLERPLPGSIYLAEQQHNPFESLLAIYIVIDDEERGIVVKLAGHVEIGGQAGVAGLAPSQIRTTVDDNPQIPFEDIRLHFFGEERQPLNTPPTCGSYRTTSDLTPWSENGSERPSSELEVSEGPGGSACANTPAEEPNKPTFTAGTVTSTAATYSPFVMELHRADGSQPLEAINMILPPGLIGKIAGVAQCPQYDIEQAEHRSHEGEGAIEQADPSCPASSEIGTVTVGAGSGTPFYLKTGHAYFAGPYKGASFSVVIITPAVAGPFDLGTVVVRAALSVNPHTAQVTVKSDQIPQLVNASGIPTDVRSIALDIDRSQFTLNPTSCEKMTITGTAFGESSEAALSSPFQVGGCESLPFKPSLTVSAQGRASKADGASLDFRGALGAGGANVAKIAVTLPKALPSRLTTIQKACLAAVFEANPATCDEGSVIGTAIVHTPILSNPVSGPASPRLPRRRGIPRRRDGAAGRRHHRDPRREGRHQTRHHERDIQRDPGRPVLDVRSRTPRGSPLRPRHEPLRERQIQSLRSEANDPNDDHRPERRSLHADHQDQH